MEQNPSKRAYEEAARLCERERCRNWDAKECAGQIREQLVKKPRDYLKQPQPGDIVEYMIATNDDVVWIGWWAGERMVSDCTTLDGDTKYRNPVAIWRWPGEKEWRR